MYFFHTQIGTFKIIRQAGRWHVMLNDEGLGSYPSPLQALDDLVGGHTHFPACGTDPSTLDIPDELSEWASR